VDAKGHLVSAEGHSLLGTDGLPLQIDPDKPVEVATDGTVRQNGSLLGRLQLAELPDPASFTKVGRNYFRLLDPAAKPTQATQAQVHQGKLESSNVSPAESAVRLVSVMRQFEMLQRAISMSAEMNKKAVEEVARVGS
jgi:flagellar basal body rod protein FlgG